MAFTPLLVNSSQVNGALQQEGFWWRNDDGSESSATYIGSQDEGTSLDLDTPLRLRVLINAQSIDPASKLFRLKYKRTVDSVWSYANEVSGKVRLKSSGNIGSRGKVTTAQLTAPSGKTTANFKAGYAVYASNGGDSVDIGSNQYTEMEWCIVASTAGGAANGDIYQFRVTAQDSAAPNDNLDDNSIDWDKWWYRQSGGSVGFAEQNGRLETTGTSVTSGDDTEFRALGTWNIGSSQYFQWHTSQIHASVDTLRTFIYLYDYVNNLYLGWFFQGGDVKIRKTDGGDTIPYNVTWDSNHVWLRFEESSGNILCRSAADSGGSPGSWTTRYTFTPTTFNIAFCKILFFTIVDTTDTGVTPCYFDKVSSDFGSA